MAEKQRASRWDIAAVLVATGALGVAIYASVDVHNLGDTLNSANRSAAARQMIARLSQVPTAKNLAGRKFTSAHQGWDVKGVISVENYGSRPVLSVSLFVRGKGADGEVALEGPGAVVGDPQLGDIPACSRSYVILTGPSGVTADLYKMSVQINYADSNGVLWSRIDDSEPEEYQAIRATRSIARSAPGTQRGEVLVEADQSSGLSPSAIPGCH